MVIPEDREGRTDDHPDFVRDPRKASEMAMVPLSDTRQMAAKNVREVVVVDMREFRSELPSLLHRRGIDILPITIEVNSSLPFFGCLLTVYIFVGWRLHSDSRHLCGTQEP